MPKKTSPVFQKVSNLFRVSIFVAKLTKPIIPKLILLKNTRKLKKFKLLKHYNYGYIQEYQFSPSKSSPLIHYYHRKNTQKKREHRDVYSIFLTCACLGRPRPGEGGDVEYPLEALPAYQDLQEVSGSREEEDSVDERAERFIERFYEEMRRQRQESLLQLMES